MTCIIAITQNNTYNGNTNETSYNIILSATNDFTNEQMYKCEKCKYTCYRKSNYNRHLTSNKHIQNAKIHEAKRSGAMQNERELQK
jgi:hypothetical protein